MILGLTGSFGSGKSTVASMLHELGLPIQDADQAARDAVAPGTPALQEIVATFGDGVLNADGSLDRKKMAEIVFKNSEARAKLNAIVHPRVGIEQMKFLQANRDAPAIVLEIPLLLEARERKGMDKVIVVTASEKARFGRLRRAGFTEKEIIARLGAQMPQSRKVQLADAVVDNSGNLEATRRQVQQLAESWGLTPALAQPAK